MAFLSEHIKDPLFNVIADTGQELGFSTFVIGGYVRDALMGRASKDIDFVCLGSGVKLAQSAARAIDKKIKVTVYKNFGTAMFRYKDYHLEFVGARKESYRANSRNPIVEDGTLEDDQNRRDFTFNPTSFPFSSINL